MSMKKTCKLPVTVLLLVSSLTSVQAQQQPVPSSDSSLSKAPSLQHAIGRVPNLNEVVVTASKFSRKAGETGKVINIIGKEALDRSGGKDLAQILTEQAGIVVNGATSNLGLNKSIFVRGASNRYTLFLINGIPISDPTEVGGAFDPRLIPLDQIERIEIMKGAQSTLYGSDAVAAVINIITKEGGKKAAELSGSIGYGSFGTLRAQAALQGQADEVKYQLSFTHQQTKGISEAKPPTTATDAFDKDGFVNNALQFQAEGKIHPRLVLRPFFRYSYFSGDFDGGSFTDAANSYKSRLLSTGTQLTFTHQHGAVKAQVAYDEVEREFISSFPSTFNGTNHTAEVFGNYRFNSVFELLGGIEQRWQKLNDPNATPANPNIQSTSPYLVAFLKTPNNKWNLELGGRLISNNRFGEQFTYSIHPSVQVNPKLKLFANYATAFKAPSLSQLYGAFGANPNLKPEEAYSTEAGTQLELWQQKIKLRLTAFHRDIKNVMVFRGNTVQNFDRQQDKGIEFEPSLNLWKKLEISAFYTYVTGEVSTQVNNKDTSFFNLLRRPKHSVGINAGYKINQQFFVSAHYYTYSSRTESDFSTFPATPVILPAYGLLNFYAEFKPTDQWRIYVDLKNVLDRNYQEVLGYSNMPRNIFVGCRFTL